MLNHAQTLEVSVSETPKRCMNVLVLDDSEMDRRRLIRLCEDAGLSVNVTEAANIPDFRNALAEQSHDIIFIDHLLAGEDGLQAVKIVVNSPSNSAVAIMIAGEGRMNVAIEAMRLGCSDYLTKSELSVDSLRKSVATALERQLAMMTLNQEREKRIKLEQSIRQYASTSSQEMRSLLAGTLRRVRKLRAHRISEAYAIELGELESNVNRLWDALPELSDDAFSSLADSQAHAPLRLLTKH